jgi:glycogen synthase
MRILLTSYSFYPNIGGIEEMSRLLASEFTLLGHEVKILTMTQSNYDLNCNFAVISNPSIRQFISLTKWCDVFFQNNICMQLLWPLLLVRKPLIIAHHTWITRLDGTTSLKDILKKNIARFSTSISVSHEIAQHIPVPSFVIGNPYDDELFMEIEGIKRERQLIFVGRLTLDKGVDLLIQALARLKVQNLNVKLTIVGQGEEEIPLKNLAKNLNLTEQIEFTGFKTGLELVRILNAHQIMVVPSRWNEPFGIVALEGIACGCVVAGSEGGGLKDAIGPCGVTFLNGDVRALTEALSSLLLNQEKLMEYRTHVTSHLSKYQKSKVSKEYLSLFYNVLNNK